MSSLDTYKLSAWLYYVQSSNFSWIHLLIENEQEYVSYLIVLSAESRDRFPECMCFLHL